MSEKKIGNYKGFNFFSKEDQQVFEAIARGEFNIRGLRNKQLRDRRMIKARQTCVPDHQAIGERTA